VALVVTCDLDEATGWTGIGVPEPIHLTELGMAGASAAINGHAALLPG
jgi:hypothetical protein